MTHKQWFNNVLHLHPVHEEGAFFWGGGGGDVELNYSPGYCFAIVISYCFSPVFLDSRQ